MADISVLRPIELKTHALLRVRDGRDLQGEARLAWVDESLERPAWVKESLERAPWVVVRRALRRNGLVPVGVRGAVREQRHAAWVAVEAVLECVTPQELVFRRVWRSVVDRSRLASIPALAMLDEVDGILDAHGLGASWGPGGSVGFELASGIATATAGSDLDLIIEIEQLESFAPSARALWEALAKLPVRVDALLEMSDGAVVLSEYAQVWGNGGSFVLSEYAQARGGGGAFVLRTAAGPRLIRAAAAIDAASAADPTGAVPATGSPRVPAAAIDAIALSAAMPETAVSAAEAEASAAEAMARAATPSATARL